ncbi:probable ribosomal protein L14.e.B, cytosolic [Cephalotrichum gorgonifer]|uniref:Probable ribosomal protein L14.e.B, cytosolic n=1 Tax=Cephalotrichum gorgonifer TaxID=2041049 RepID=A0AAE8N2U3_9PEZI|nr:probable ribosomal protein L14.e.B, cytosolic [Cephalotrichum gorgonifer]
MGEATIQQANWRLVEVGRVVLIQSEGPSKGRLAAVVEIIDHKRVLVEGTAEGAEVPRQPVRLSDVLLSNMVVADLPRGARHAALKKFWAKSEIDAKWKETSWFKRRQQNERRQALTDFDRFKVMRLKKQRRFEERRVLAKIRTAAKA